MNFRERKGHKRELQGQTEAASMEDHRLYFLSTVELSSPVSKIVVARFRKSGIWMSSLILSAIVSSYKC